MALSDKAVAGLQAAQCRVCYLEKGQDEGVTSLAFLDELAHPCTKLVDLLCNTFAYCVLSVQTADQDRLARS